MSTSDEFPPPSADPHVADELPALVAGELDVDAAGVVTVHLRACSRCRQELVEVASGIGMMRRLDSFARGVEPASPRPGEAGPRPTRARPSWSRATGIAAAAVLVVMLGVTAAVIASTSRGSSGPEARVELTPVTDRPARGSVAMRPSGAAAAMEVETSLGAAPPNRYYEVWLLDRASGKMLAVGVLPPDGAGTFRLPGEIIDGYDTVDISVQPDNGDPNHSRDSILRADYA